MTTDSDSIPDVPRRAKGPHGYFHYWRLVIATPPWFGYCKNHDKCPTPRRELGTDERGKLKPELVAARPDKPYDFYCIACVTELERQDELAEHAAREPE